MIFWILIALVASAGVALLAWPTLRAARATEAGSAGEQDHLRRLSEFEADVAAGDIAAEDAPAVRADLERAVLDALPRPPATPRAGRPPLALLLFAPLVALGVYLELGAPDVGRFLAADPARSLSEPRVALELLLAEVRQRVADDPADRAAWDALAHAYMQLGRYDEAVTAAERAAALAGDDPDALLVLVDALAMQADGALDGRPTELIERVLALDPGNLGALVLSGIAHDKAGRRAPAIEAWRKALASMPPDSPLHAQLGALIGNAAGLGSGAAPAAAAGPVVGFDVAVSLAPELAGRAGDDDTVFVVARAVDGPPMPLAVARHRVADLPLTVTLDSTMAMAPGASLADAAQVRVIARVSRGGDATAAPGDLEGRSAPFDPRAGQAPAVLIDRVVGEAEGGTP